MIPFDPAGRTTTGGDLFKNRPKKSKTASRTTPPAVQLGEHGRYQVKSGRLAGEYVARAFPKPPTTARGLIAEAKGATEEAAIAALHELINARDVRRAEQRRLDPQTGAAVPSTEEYAEAIAQVALSRPQLAMLKALALADGDGLSERRMANAAGYKSLASANRAFAAAGLLIANYLATDTTSSDPARDLEGSAFLGYRGEQRNDEEPGHWMLHNELSEAVRSTL